MKRILIPADRSKASDNAIRFAVGLSLDYPVKEIILLVNDHVTTFEQIIPTADFIQYSFEKAAESDKHIEHRFNELKHTLLKSLNPSVRVSFILSKVPFLQAIDDIVEQEHPDLLLIGNNHGISESEGYISDHLINIAENSTIPVLIISQSFLYKPLKKALVPFNHSNISTIDLIKKLEELTEYALPEFFLLNVDPSAKELAENDSDERIAALNNTVSHFNYQVFRSTTNDVIAGIRQFALENDVQLIVALPGQHNILYKLTHRNVIEALARNHHIPVLILKN